MVAEHPTVDASVEQEGVDLGIHRVEKIVSDADVVGLIKMIARL